MRTMRRYCQALRGRSRGQALLETALSLPFVMALVMGVIDLGFVLYAHVQVAAAAMEGARAGSLTYGDLAAGCATNDSARLAAVRKAIYDPLATPPTSALGRLNPTSPNFDVNSLTYVQVDYESPCSSGNTIRSGEKMKVTVRYDQPVLFSFLPGVNLGKVRVTSSTWIRIQ